MDTVQTAIYRMSVQGAAELDKAAASVDKLATSETKLIAANDQVVVTQEKVSRATRTTADGLDRLIASVDRRAQAEQRLQRQLEQIRRYEDEGVGSKAKISQATELVTQKYNAQIATIGRVSAAHNDNTAATGKAIVSTGQMRASVQNLGFQLNDVATSLASGGGLFRVLAQQSGQVLQAFTQGGGFAAVGRQIAGMVTPTRAAGAGLAVVAGGFALVISKAIEAEGRVRSFRVILDSMSTSSLTSAADLEKVVERLRDTGSTVGAATAAVQGIARTPNIDPRAIGGIAETARDIAAARGTDFAATAASLGKALTGTAEEMLKFDQELGVRFLPLEHKAIAALLQQRDSVGVVAVAYAALTRTFKGDFQNSLSDTQKLVNEVETAWTHLLESGANSSLIQEWLRGIKLIGETWDKWIGDRKAPAGFSMTIDEGRQRFPLGRSSEDNIIASAPIPPLHNPATVPQGITGPMAEVPALQAQAGKPLLLPNAAAATELAKQTAEIALQATVYGKLGVALVEAKARVEALKAAEALKIEGTEKDIFVTAAIAKAIADHNDELRKAAATQAIATAGVLKTAAAYGVSLVAGLEAAAAAQAKLDVRSGAATNERARTAELLRTASAESIKSSAEQRAANENVVAAQERLAAATMQGTAAARAQEVQNEALAKTDKMVSEALATRDEGLIRTAMRERELTIAQDKRRESATQSTAAAADTNALRRQGEQVGLQQGMVGKDSDELARQSSLLAGAQKLADNYAGATEKVKDNFAAATAELANQNFALAKLKEQQERTQAVFKGIASSIESTLGTAIDDVFAGKKIDNWGARLKGMWASIQSTIAKETLLKPFLGTPLSVVPAGEFGTLGKGGVN